MVNIAALLDLPSLDGDLTRLEGALRASVASQDAFLAVLELYKQGMVDLAQVGTFGELHITWLGRDENTPLDELEIEEYAG